MCTKCGMMGYYDHKLKIALCTYCKSGENMATMKLPYACKLLFQVSLLKRYFSPSLICVLGCLLINSNYCYCDPWAGASINEYSPAFATFRGIMSGNQLAGAGKQSKTAISSR